MQQNEVVNSQFTVSKVTKGTKVVVSEELGMTIYLPKALLARFQNATSFRVVITADGEGGN